MCLRWKKRGPVYRWNERANKGEKRGQTRSRDAGRLRPKKTGPSDWKRKEQPEKDRGPATAGGQGKLAEKKLLW